MTREQIMTALEGYGREKGVAFLSQEEAVEYWRGLVEVIEGLVGRVMEEREELTVIDEQLVEIAEMIANGNAFSKENGLIWEHIITEAKRLSALKEALTPPKGE